MLQHVNLLTIVSFLTAAAIAGSRILVATRPAWSKMPSWAQILLPLIVPALTTLAQQLAGVKTGVDLTTVLIGCILLAVPGLPSNRSSAPMQAGVAPTLSPSPQDVAVSANVVKIASIAPPERMFPSVPPSDDTPKWGGPSGGLVLLLAVAFAVHSSACSIFGSHGSFWPKVENCAPSPASLVSQVADILLAGGDYEEALKQKALIDGAAAVECAVQAAVNSLIGRAGKIGASPEDGAAEARGKAFLAKHPVGQ